MIYTEEIKNFYNTKYNNNPKEFYNNGDSRFYLRAQDSKMLKEKKEVFLNKLKVEFSFFYTKNEIISENRFTKIFENIEDYNRLYLSEFFYDFMSNKGFDLEKISLPKCNISQPYETYGYMFDINKKFPGVGEYPLEKDYQILSYSQVKETKDRILGI